MPETESTQHADRDVQRHWTRDLAGLDVNGRPCEACGRHMHAHEWADLDEWGFVVACVFSCTSTTTEAQR